MMQSRHYDIDWLRVIAIVLVLFFHVGMIFTSEWGWHIKNPEQSDLVLEFNFWLSRFRMHLLFFISGVGTFYALRKRTSWKYIKERNNRLMIPLLFAMFVVVPPQIYMERMMEGASYLSFFHFYPSVLELVPYPEGDFSWHHMWFVLYLFFYSLVALPLFLFLRSNTGQQLLERLSPKGKGNQVWLLVIPTILIYLFISFGNERTNDFVSDFAWHPYWLSFFVMGYVVACGKGWWEAIEKRRRNFLGWALAAITFMNVLRWNGLEPWDQEAPNAFFYLFSQFVFVINSWLWVLAILGFGKRYLNKPSRLLTYANQAIYPFYILHQTIIVIVGFYVIQVDGPSIMAKYWFVSILSMVGSLAIYEFLIRPYRLTRFLFGVKSANKKVAQEESPTGYTKKPAPQLLEAEA